MQFDAKRILGLLQQRLSAMTTCFTAPIRLETGDDVYFDHATFTADGSFQAEQDDEILVYGTERANGRWIQLVQPVTLHLATLAQLEAAQADAASYMTVTAILTLDIFVAQDTDGLWLHLDLVDIQTLLTPIPDDLREMIYAWFADASPPTPIDLAGLSTLTNRDVVVAAAFLGADRTFERLAIRIELESDELEGASEWSKFLNGDIDDNLHLEWEHFKPGTWEFDDNGKPIKKEHVPGEVITYRDSGDWSLYLDFGLLETRLFDSVLSMGSDEFYVQQNTIDVDWVTPIEANACAVIRFTGTGHWVVDVDADVCVSLGFFVNAEGQLETSGSISWEKDLGDEIVAALVASFLFAMAGMIVGASIGSAAGGPVGGTLGAGIGALVGGIVGGISTYNFISGYKPSPTEQAGCETSDDATSFLCTEDVPLPNNPLIGEMTLTSIRGLAGGPVLLGTLPEVDVQTTQITAVTVNSWSWGHSDPCGTPSLRVVASIRIQASGSQSIELCAWSVLDDELGVLNDMVTVDVAPGTPDSAIQVEIAIPHAELEQYLALPESDHYAFPILLQTSAGVRLITLAPISALSADDQAHLAVELEAAKMKCMETAAPFWRSQERFNPQWAVDPGPDGYRAERLWTISINGLNAGETLLVRDTAGTILANATPTRDGITRTEVLTADGTAIGLEREAVQTEIRSHAHSSKHRRVRIEESLLVRSALFDVGSACVALTAGMMGGDPVALCVTQQGGLTIFDVSDPYRPRLRLRRDEPGLRGALLWSGEVLAWGRHGLRRLSGAEPQTLMDRAISAVRASGATLVVEDECGALYLFDTRLRRSTNAPTQQRPRTRRAGWLAEAATVGRTWLRSDRSTIEVWHATRSVTPD